MLRPYQQNAVTAAFDWVKKSYESCLIDAATGAGKSHIIAELARLINGVSGKKILCLAPSKELVEQNHKKYLATGNPASIYSASIGKSLAHDVVFASPVTVLNSIDKFGSNYAAVIVDEAHGITPTIQRIIDHLRMANDKLRVIGTTATPYRMGMGLIYRYDEKGNPIPDDTTKDPYFNRLVYKIPAKELIEQGYLTPPVFDIEVCESYDTDGLKVNRMGLFNAHDVECVFEGRGRKTSNIVADFVANSQGRNGVMVFASTIQHAQEVMESLDPENSQLITGKTKKKERERLISEFKDMRFKYLVNVAVLTTGFDAEHVDHIVILRATESPGLLQQIIGRGLRLCDNKPDCLVSDYAKNIERHCPDGDVFNPQISVSRGGESFELTCECPTCGVENTFAGRKNDEGFEHDINGYFIDLLGQQVIADDDLPMPAHHGRRCYGQQIIKGGSVRCDYRWSLKQCECGHENDIAARYCEKCKAELVDPNEKLVIDFHKMKSDPYQISTDKVLSWRAQLWTSAKGNETVKINYTTQYAEFSAFYFPSSSSKNQNRWESICSAVFDNYERDPIAFMERIDEFEGSKPLTITYAKNRKSKYFDVFDHNRSEDEIPELATD
jgi:DNA repair protein RadD